MNPGPSVTHLAHSGTLKALLDNRWCYGSMMGSARQSSRMSPHWTIYAAGACSIALAVAIVVMILLT